MDKMKLAPLQVADKWASMTVKFWIEKLWKLRIGKSGGELRNSFTYKVKGSSDGSLISIVFNFKYQGKFVDMGVGRGVKIGGVHEAKLSRYYEGKKTGNKRVPKKWYGKTFYHETATLKEILVRDFAHKGVIQITESINSKSINT